MPIISKTPAGRVVVAAGFGVGVGLLLWPVPLALGAACWPALRHLAEATHSAGGIAQVEMAWAEALPSVWQQWLAHGGYAPWHAIPALFPYGVYGLIEMAFPHFWCNVTIHQHK